MSEEKMENAAEHLDIMQLHKLMNQTGFRPK